MADNKGGNGMPGFFKDMWKEFTNPPKWMKEGSKPGSASKKETKKDAKKEDGKKTEADASTTPKKRQPPSWWSWSESDGVPGKRRASTNKKRSGSSHSQTVDKSSSSKSSIKPAPKLSTKSSTSTHKQTHTKRSRPAMNTRGDMGSSQGDDATIQGQIRRHGYAPAVLKPFGLVVTKVEPFGPVLRLRTNKGLIALKKADLNPKQIQFLHDVCKHLERNRYSKVAPFLLTNNGNLPYAQIGGDTYYATQWIRGQEVNFHSLPQLAMASRSLAEFHEASLGFEPKGYRPSMLFDMVDRFSDRRDELVQWKRRAHQKSRPDEVDKLFLKHVDLYIKQSEQALTILKRPEVRRHLLLEEDDPVLCHLDLTPYNMVYAQTGDVYLIDLDFCTHGPRTLDVAHLLRRALQRQEWQEDVARHVLVNYNSVRMMNQSEYEILHGLLLFPHRFWRIAYEHYDVGHNPHHLGFFQLAEAEEQHRQQFLTRFAQQVERIRR